MEAMNEKDRKKIILESQKFGGISLRRQKLRVHKNGAKFPVSKAYIDDELLDPEITYTLILIPEVKIASKSAIALNYFHRRIGPKTFYSYPEDVLNEDIKAIIANIGFQAGKDGFFVHQSSILSSLNHYFEIPSDWARGNKEIMEISVILDTVIDREVEKIIQSLCIDFISQITRNKGFFKALYFEVLDKYSEEERSEIEKISENLRTRIKEFYKKVIISIRQKKEQ